MRRISLLSTLLPLLLPTCDDDSPAGAQATFMDFKGYRNTLKYLKQKAIIIANVKNAQRVTQL